VISTFNFTGIAICQYECYLCVVIILVKKTITFILAFFYLAISSGVIINLHYCMNKVDSVQYYQEGTDICGKCGMHKDEASGCHDEIKVVKLSDDHQPSSIDFAIAGISPEFTIPSAFIIASFENADTEGYFVNHSPPLISLQDTYLRNCVFRI
jgi:hypothetical protein